MANLVLTNECNQRCSYCFAGSFLQSDPSSVAFVSESEFLRYLDFLSRSGINQVRLLGGEPTLHPQFSRFVRTAFERGMQLTIFSNGLMPESALQALLELPVECVNVLVNVTPTSEQGLKPRQEQVITQLGQRAHLGYTLSQTDCSGLFNLIDIVEKTHCCPSIRIGLAQPSSGGNLFISPKHYQRTAAGILGFIRAAHQKQIGVEFDCGFVRCMFTDREVAELEKLNINFGWHCDPVLDISSGGWAIPCFSLADEFRLPGALEGTANILRTEFKSQAAHLRVIGVFPECSTCTLRVTEGCSGGCLAMALRRTHDQSFSIDIPILEEV